MNKTIKVVDLESAFDIAYNDLKYIFMFASSFRNNK